MQNRLGADRALLGEREVVLLATRLSVVDEIPLALEIVFAHGAIEVGSMPHRPDREQVAPPVGVALDELLAAAAVLLFASVAGYVLKVGGVQRLGQVFLGHGNNIVANAFSALLLSVIGCASLLLVCLLLRLRAQHPHQLGLAVLEEHGPGKRTNQIILEAQLNECVGAHLLPREALCMV
jgi:hypothetical protein